MKIQHITFKRDVILYGSYVLPKSVSMDLDEHKAKWSLHYNHDWHVIEALILDERSGQKGTTYVIPRELAQSWKYIDREHEPNCAMPRDHLGLCCTSGLEQPPAAIERKPKKK